MNAPSHSLQVRIRIYCGEEIAMGPGKADLLDAIVEKRSISGAARQLGMSYRRAWLLVDTMNRCWREPLVATANGGGASVTEAGAAALAGYRQLQSGAESALTGDCWRGLEAHLLAAPRAHQGEN